MAVLDDLRALAQTLPAEVKPVAAEVVDVVGAIVQTLEAAGVKVPAPVQEGVTVAEDVTAPEEPATVGGAVYDVAGAADAPPPPSAPTASVSELEQEIAAKQDELQSLQVQLADAQKTVHTSDTPPAA